MFLTRKVYLGTCAKGQHFFKNGTEWVVLDRNGEFLTCQNTTTDETKEFSEVDIVKIKINLKLIKNE